MAANAPNQKRQLLTAVVANAQREIFDLEGYAAVGGSSTYRERLTVGDTLRLPHGSELMMLPDRRPVLYNLERGQIEILDEHPYLPGEPIFPVAAFNSPGYVISQTCAYEEDEQVELLPLFSYGAVGWHQDAFHSAVIQVDDEPRQDLRLMPLEKVQSGVKRMRRRMSKNRLRAHLEKCALTYSCPAGKNFFLGRYEAPLPTATACNARCLGCISLQSEGRVPCSQERISFTPSPREIAEVALAHIERVKNAVIRWGPVGPPLTSSKSI